MIIRYTQKDLVKIYILANAKADVARLKRIIARPDRARELLKRIAEGDEKAEDKLIKLLEESEEDRKFNEYIKQIEQEVQEIHRRIAREHRAAQHHQ